MKNVSAVLEELNISSDELAERSRLSPERVKRLLAGEDATLADLRAISRGLRIPLTRFVKTENSENSEMMFRSNASGRIDLGVEAAQSFVKNALKILPESQAAVPTWINEFGVQYETPEEAKRLASAFRLKYCSDSLDEPLLNLSAILANLNVVLARLDTSRFEGASIVASGYAFIFVSARIPSRMLFTLAHELGHLIAHHTEKQKAIFDLPSQIGSHRPANGSEKFVDAFASELLLPDQGVALALQAIREGLRVDSDDIGDIEIAYLARIFGVSFITAAIKCEKLGLLPRGGAFSLNDHLKKSFGSAEKRADGIGIPPRPRIDIPAISSNLLRSAVNKIESGEVSLGWVTDSFGCTASDIYASRLSSRMLDGHRH